MSSNTIHREATHQSYIFVELVQETVDVKIIFPAVMNEVVNCVVSTIDFETGGFGTPVSIVLRVDVRTGRSVRMVPLKKSGKQISQSTMEFVNEKRLDGQRSDLIVG